MAVWHIVTGEYPPQRGGVADYTRLVALGLAAHGERVHVWAPAVTDAELAEAGVEVHRLPGRFGPRSLAALGRGLDTVGAGQILMQYVPQMFGMKGMNLPLCLWLLFHKRIGINIMFHEVSVEVAWRQPLRHSVIGIANRAMLLVLTRAARRCFVATPHWETLIRPFAPAGILVTWLPVPSNVPVVDDPAAVQAIRKRLMTEMAEGGMIIGHFGTARETWIAGQLGAVALPLLRRRPNAVFLLLGKDSLELRGRLLAQTPELRGRVLASGPLASVDLSRYLGACDVMLQPYADGVTTRRTSLMAALAHRRTVVTTSGLLTEPLWRQSGAVALVEAGDTAAMGAALAHLMDDAEKRALLGAAAGALYAQRFDIGRTIAALRKDCRPGNRQ